MSRVSFVNGMYCDYKSASVHIEDRGYQFADGVYEVFAVINSKLIDYDGHINRLYKSLKEIKLNSPLAKESYLFHIKNLVKKNYINNGLIYLQVTRGVSKRDFKFPKNVKPSVVPDALFKSNLSPPVSYSFALPDSFSICGGTFKYKMQDLSLIHI